MTCPKCGRTGRKGYEGYCTRVHRDLHKKPNHVILACANCNSRVIRTPSRISKGGKAYCDRCSKNTGENHGNWKEGQYLNPQGYRLILHKNAYVLAHRIAWEQNNRACIHPSLGGIIHHINFQKTDNRPKNLVLLSGEEHGRIHKLIELGKHEEAKCKLLQYAEQQVFFLQHSEVLGHIRESSLHDTQDWFTIFT